MVLEVTLTTYLLNNSLPSDLKKIFKLNMDVHSHGTWQLFHVPRVNKSTYGINSIKYYYPNLWNNTWKNGVTIDSDHNNNVRFE